MFTIHIHGTATDTVFILHTGAAGTEAGITVGTAITDGIHRDGTGDGTGTTTGVGTTLGTEVHIGDGTILSMILGGVRHTGPAIGPDTGLHTDRDSILATIIRDITPGADEAGKPYEVVVDRIEAIRYAMDMAKKDDIIVLAGKGHETYQEIMGVKHHMDEREIVAGILKEKRG